MSGILMMSVGASYGYKPVNTVVPAVTGTATVGQTLSCSTGTWDAAPPSITYTYQWQRGTTNISGATSSTYVIQSADAGNTLRCVVTATNAVGATSANSNSTASVTQVPANTVAPVVSGTATVGQTLSTTTGSWTGTPTPTYTYQWQRSGSNIGGATGSTYTLVSADAGATIRCVVTATNSAGSASANSNSTAAVAQAPANTAAPTISGTTQVGSTLSSTTGTWTGTPTPTYSYQWQRNGSNIGGATGSTYALVTSDEGKSIRCVVTATNSAGSVSANSNATAAVSAPAFGASYGGGYYTGKIVVSGTTYYVIVSPKASGLAQKQWSTAGGVAGPAATVTLNNGAAASGSMNSSTYPAAQFCEGLSINGYTDWYLPSRDELELCYRNLKPDTTSSSTSGRSIPNYTYPEGNDVPGDTMGINRNSSPAGSAYTSGSPVQTSATLFQTGNSEAFEATNHLSSSDATSNSVWTQSFSAGYQDFYSKTNIFRVRAVRRIAM